jgi:transposase
MPGIRSAAGLLPSGLVVDAVTLGGDDIVISARAPGRGGRCPTCGDRSKRVHSSYERCLADLPAHGRRVRLKVSVRRFRCTRGECSRRLFAERLETGIARPYARRTTRLQQVVRCLGLALGGRPGQGMARRLLFPVSKDTLLRSIRVQAGSVDAAEPRVIGIDDWAWKKGHRYGTIICDLELHRVIDILPDRESGTVEAWLAEVVGGGRPRKCPSARAIARLMTLRRDHLTRDEALTVALVETGVPRRAEAARLVDDFQKMIRNRTPDLLDTWLKQAEQGLLSSFARGLQADRKAIVAAMDEPWSNGQTEGQINRLKTLKRQMYSRAKLDLLRARMTAA